MNNSKAALDASVYDLTLYCDYLRKAINDEVTKPNQRGVGLNLVKLNGIIAQELSLSGARYEKELERAEATLFLLMKAKQENTYATLGGIMPSEDEGIIPNFINPVLKAQVDGNEKSKRIAANKEERENKKKTPVKSVVTDTEKKLTIKEIEEQKRKDKELAKKSDAGKKNIKPEDKKTETPADINKANKLVVRPTWGKNKKGKDIFSDPKYPIYGSLTVIPNMKEEDKISLNEAWKSSKGDVEKAAVYNKVLKLLNNYSLSISELRTILTNFEKSMRKLDRKSNEDAFVAILVKQKIVMGIGASMDDVPSGKDLIAQAANYTVDGEFNLPILTGKKSPKEMNEADYVKLRACHLRITQRNDKAIDTLIKFFSNKDHTWNEDIAKWFLNTLFDREGYLHLYKALENIIMHSVETEKDYRKGIPAAKKLLVDFSTFTEKDETKAWKADKIDNFIDKILDGLAKLNLIKLVKSPIKEKLENIAATSDKDKPAEQEKGKETKAAQTASDGSSQAKADTKIHTVKKDDSGNPKQGQSKIPTAGQKVGKTQKEKDDLKAAKAANKASEKKETVKKEVDKTNTNVEKKEETPIDTKDSKAKAEYTAMITIEKDGTYSCVMVGFDDISVANSKSIDEVKTDFIEALADYKFKIDQENASSKKKRGKKGKLIHMKPDFSKGELTFQTQTGT